LVAQKPVNAAERVPEVAARLAVDGVEQLAGFAGFLGHGGAGLDDRGLAAAQPMGGTHRAAEILGGDAPIHPPAVIARSQKITESLENLGLDSLRQFVAPPRFADQAFGALA